MRGSELDKGLKDSIILGLVHIGVSNFILPNGTYKLMEDKYEVKLDTIRKFWGVYQRKTKKGIFRLLMKSPKFDNKYS